MNFNAWQIAVLQVSAAVGSGAARKQSVSLVQGGFRVRSLVSLSLLILLIVFLQDADAADENLQFASADNKQLYQQLTRELRCLKCQNQNLADSPAGLAEDLKAQIHKMVAEGQSAAQIKDYMVTRYGDFILYRPQFKPLTMVLWILPFVLMLLGLLVVIRLSAASRAATRGSTNSSDGDSVGGSADSTDSLHRARQLLDED